ncbi:cupin domain-containing protein [Bosea sp. PAMC 26642]|uniref:cupin domain-containing protein n=1 Tax=Bosea sp. (strain PAMC 26642) TaxID=1792307 RepID=UPI000770072F|nr:cupin domain-containing protein [Bosea sp. PAMC 26642]AMJ60993.1 hypothetical protein AXW83_12425 [Bosea sp. PAMC 26642]
MKPSILVLARAGGNPVATRFTKGGLSAQDPFADIREIAWSDEGGIAAGRVPLESRRDVRDFPHIEMLVVETGSLTLTSGATALVIGPGRGAVIAPGTDFTAEGTPGTRFSFCSAAVPAELPAGIFELGPDAPLAPSKPPPADMLESEMPQCRSSRKFDDTRAGFIAGTWDSTAYQRKIRPHPVHELMHLIEGSVELTGSDGEVTRLDAGDCGFIARGADNRWDSRGKVAKFYAVQG